MESTLASRRVCPLLGAQDSDLLQVEWNGRPQRVRLAYVSPEPASVGRSRSPTDFGRATFAWARENWLAGTDEVVLEFVGRQPTSNHSDMPPAIVHIRGENYNTRLIREGYSPWFIKYGYPERWGEEMERAEMHARYEGRGIWGGPAVRDYERMRRYWLCRAGQVEAYRRAATLGEDILDCRLDCDEILSRARAESEASVFADPTRSYHMADGSVLIQLGSSRQPLAVYLGPESRRLAHFMERVLLHDGCPPYVFFRAPLSMAGEQPQILVTLLEQFALTPFRQDAVG